MNNRNMTYKQPFEANDVWRYAKAVILPTVVFFTCVYTINRLGAFGTSIAAVMICIMWGVGVLTAALIPAQRTSTLRETMGTVFGYCLALIAFRLAIQMVSGVSSEMMATMYDDIVPVTGGTTISGYLQSAFWIAAIMPAIAFTLMQGKKLLTFRKTSSKTRFFEQIRGIRSNNDTHLR